jgi:hypothetical protein
MQNSVISLQNLSCFATRCLTINDRALQDESGIVRTQMGKHNRPDMVAVYGTPCAIPPRNCNSGDQRTSD